LNAEVDKDMKFPRKPRGDGAQTTTSLRNPSMAFSTGLMKTKTCTISVEMDQIMVLIISKKIAMTAELTKELMVHLSAYFSHMGIHNEEYLSFMTNYVDWPLPQKIATPK